MKTRSLVLGAVVAGLAFAMPSQAALPCNLVLDPADDTYLLRSLAGQPGQPQEAAADILSADLASNAKDITVVWRVKGLAASGATSPYGWGYTFQFTTSKGADKVMFVRAFNTSDGQTAEGGTIDALPAVTSISTVLGTGTVVFDAAKNEVRATVPVATFGTVGGLAPGTKLTPVEVTVGRAAPGSRAVFADDAAGAKTYTAGNSTCVKVGK